MEGDGEEQEEVFSHIDGGKDDSHIEDILSDEFTANSAAILKNSQTDPNNVTIDVPTVTID